jgi:hypothetical protein
VSFPPQPQWQTIPPGDARELFRNVFARWGRPGRLQVDNGHPWGLNHGLPPDLALWLIGLGVDMAWIPPRKPRHNAKVERCNGVTQQWAEPSSCGSRSQLQEQLDRECLIQREQYPSIGGRPRIEAFPGLRQIERPYRVEEEDRLWELSRVDRFLSRQVYYRRANARGAISVYGWEHGLGRVHRGKEVCVKFDISLHNWIVTDHEGQELRRLPAEELSRERIMALEVGCQRTTRHSSEGGGKTPSRVGGQT